jgi:hypothetical protein
MCFDAICSAATGVIVYEIGTEINSEQAGTFAGWLWALSPYVAILPYILWDIALSALLGGLALLLTLRLASAASRRLVDWLEWGAIWVWLPSQSSPAHSAADFSHTALGSRKEMETGLRSGWLYRFVDHSLDYSELRRLP